MSLPVSTTWKEAISQQFRYPGYLKVELRLSPPGIVHNTTLQANSIESISGISKLLGPDTTIVEPVATLELNRWKGDGTMYLPSTNPLENKSIDWWSDKIPSVESPVTLLATFGSIYSFSGVYITWDAETNTWPQSADLVATHSDGSTESITIHPSAVTEHYTHEWIDVTSLQVVLTNWTKEQWRCRMHEIVFGDIIRFTNDNISNASLKSSTTLLSEELPTYDLTLSIWNYDKTFDPKLKSGYSEYLVARQQVQLQWGFETSYGVVEWMPAQPMYLSAWSIPYNAQEVSIKATNRMSFLTQKYDKGTYTGESRTMYDIALEVLSNSNIIKEYMESDPWELPDTLKSWTTTAPIPYANTNEILQLIAGYTGHILDTNPLNCFVRFRGSLQATDYTISKNQQLGDPSYTIRNQVRTVKVKIYSYNTDRDNEPKEVYRTTIHLAGTHTLIAQYSSNDTIVDGTVNITGATLVSSTCDAHRATLTVSAPEEGADVTISITGYTVESNTTTYVPYENASVLNGSSIEIDNPFITDSVQATIVALNVLAYYSKRNKIEMTYLGYPELEVGDVIYAPDTYNDNIGCIEQTSITFNGGFTGSVTFVAEEDN